MAGLLDFLGFGGGQQPMQAQTSMQQPQQQGGLFSGRLGALNDPAIALPLAGALMQPGDIGSNLGQGFALAGQGVATRKKLARERAVENATAQYLEAQGADAGLVELAKSGAGGEALQLFTQMKKQNDLMTVGKNIYNPNTGQWIQAPAGMGGDDIEYGLQPVYGQDAQGNTVLGQVSKSGTFKPLDMPEGFKPSTGADKVDLGTQWGIIDRRTGQITQYIPKDVAGEASQKVVGTNQGEAQFALPAAKLAVDTAVQQAEQLQNDRYLPSMVGPRASRLPNVTADAERVQGMMNQLGGSAFLQARQALKGGGAITDMEGQKAEAALVRANAAQNIDDYKAAIEEYKTHLRNGFAILQQQAAGAGGVPSPQGGVSGTTSTNVPFRIVQ